MFKSFVAAGVTTTALLLCAPAASADVPGDIVTGFLSGIAGAFGSSGAKPQPKQQNTIYPDFASCDHDARTLRRPGVIAECNPVGGASGQYQLIVMTR